MTKRNSEIIINEKIWKMACEANENLDEERFPQIKISLDQFLARGIEQADCMYLLGCLEAADIGKKIPRTIGNLIISLYEYAIEIDPAPVTINNLGLFYIDVRIGEKDYEKAMEYFVIADEGGCAFATENIGFMYYYGLGREVDYAMAYKYFSKAATLGRYGAMAKLGDMYRYGHYVENDTRMVYKCYSKALSMVNTDNEDANRRMGSMLYRIADVYYEGIGVRPSLERAMEYYQEAEMALYAQISCGDTYNIDKVKYVIDRQQEIREKLIGKLPVVEY